MTGEKDNALAGPLAQSIDIGFRAARFAIAILALGWATMNVREVHPDMQAVVTRLGAVDRVQQAGLVVAWPRPFERVLLMPGPAQQMTQHIEADASAALGLDEMVSKSEAPKSAHGYLTGDGGVVLIDATLTWRSSMPAITSSPSCTSRRRCGASRKERRQRSPPPVRLTISSSLGPRRPTRRRRPPARRCAPPTPPRSIVGSARSMRAAPALGSRSRARTCQRSCRPRRRPRSTRC